VRSIGSTWFGRLTLADTGLCEADLWIDEMRGVIVAGCPVLLVRREDGVVAFRDRCPHQGYPLSEGELAGGVITCRVHQHRFDAASGQGINPLGSCLVRLPVVVSNGRIAVEPGPKKAGP
jgi:toluene monooxygenase system ferredoxin subunit